MHFFFSIFKIVVAWNFPNQELNLCPLPWKHRVLSTGLPGSPRMGLHSTAKKVRQALTVRQALRLSGVGLQSRHVPITVLTSIGSGLGSSLQEKR